MLANLEERNRPTGAPPPTDESGSENAPERRPDRHHEARPRNGESELSGAQIEQWLTRSWRPAVMLLLAAILLMVGVVLPMWEALTGHRLAFEPRWNLLPPEFWDFLVFTMSGYIGGRSLEKIAAQLTK